MIAMREMPSFGLEPTAMQRVWRAHERERAIERVDDLLIVTMLGVESFRSPSPPGRELPVAQMRGQLPGGAVHLRFDFALALTFVHSRRTRITSSIRRESSRQPRRTRGR